MKFLMNWIYRQRGSCFRRCSRYRNSFSEISCSRLSMYLITTPSFAYFLTSFLFPNIDFFTTTSFFLPRNPLIVSLYFLRRSPNTFIIKVLDSFYFLATLIEGSSISREQYILLGQPYRQNTISGTNICRPLVTILLCGASKCFMIHKQFEAVGTPCLKRAFSAILLFCSTVYFSKISTSLQLYLRLLCCFVFVAHATRALVIMTGHVLINFGETNASQWKGFCSGVVGDVDHKIIMHINQSYKYETDQNYQQSILNFVQSIHMLKVSQFNFCRQQNSFHLSKQKQILYSSIKTVPKLKTNNKNVNGIGCINLILLQQILNKINTQHPFKSKQRMYSLESFVTNYSNLSASDRILSHEANQKLVALEQSQQSWNIAKELILNDKYHQNGCLLLTRKLSRIYTQEMENSLRIVDFVLGLPALNKLLWFGLAKLAIHLGWDKIQLGKHKNARNILGVLTNLPQAASIITLPPTDKSDENQRSRATKLFTNYKQFLVEIFTSFPTQVTQCIYNYVTFNYKLKSDELLKLLLTRPLDEISTTLQQLLLGQKYENLHNQIYLYLIKNQSTSDTSQFFTVFIAFSRSLPLLQLSTQILTGIFTKIISTLKLESSLPVGSEQRKEVTYIADSFDLWAELAPKINKMQFQGKSTQQLHIIQSAFVELWKIVTERSLLKQMPRFQNRQNYDSLAISLDDDETDNVTLDEIQQIADICAKNDITNSSFRQTAQDFLHMSFSTISRSQTHRKSCLSFVHELTISTNPLNLQLAIFVMSCIVEISNQKSINQISALIQSITQNSHAKDPYIWQQLIKLLGKLGHEAVCDGVIFQNALVVLKQSIQIQQLSVLACETFNQILSTCEHSQKKASQTPLLHQFFTYLYNNIYFKTTNPKVFNSLTKSSIIFIYYFHPDLEYFSNYLQALNQKIQAMKHIKDRIQIVETLAVCHNFVMPQYSIKFTSIISQFFVAFLPVIVKYIEEVPSKKLGNVMGQLGTIIGIGSGYNTAIWIQGLISLSKLPNVLQQKHLLINLFNKLISVQQTESNYLSSIIHFIELCQPFVSQSLTNSPQDNYRLINKCLAFHLLVLNKYVDKLTYQYNPDPVIVFIIGKIYTNKVKFEMESSRIALAIVRAVIAKKYHPEYLLESTLKVYKQMFEGLWKSIQAILYESYKIGGVQIYKNAFAKVHPSLLPPNPLFDSFVKAISESKAKDFKNILVSIK